MNKIGNCLDFVWMIWMIFFFAVINPYLDDSVGVIAKSKTFSSVRITLSYAYWGLRQVLSIALNR